MSRRILRGQPVPIYIRLTEVNQYITCHLCGGYLIDATTITECLHSFCKRCLVSYIKKNDLCPTCDILIHPTNPSFSIKLDPTLQEIVYKLLPYIQEDEKAREARFWKERNLKQPQKEVPPPENVALPRNTEVHIAILLEYAGASVGCPTIKPLEKKYILVPSRVTICQIQRFIEHKLNIERPLEVDIVFDEDILEPDVMLKQIWAQSSDEQMEDGMLCLYYSISNIQDEPS